MQQLSCRHTTAAGARPELSRSGLRDPSAQRTQRSRTAAGGRLNTPASRRNRRAARSQSTWPAWPSGGQTARETSGHPRVYRGRTACPSSAVLISHGSVAVQNHDQTDHVPEQGRDRSEQCQRGSDMLICLIVVQDVRGVVQDVPAQQEDHGSDKDDPQMEAEDHAGENHAQSNDASDEQEVPQEGKILFGDKHKKRQ